MSNESIKYYGQVIRDHNYPMCLEDAMGDVVINQWENINQKVQFGVGITWLYKHFNPLIRLEGASSISSKWEGGGGFLFENGGHFRNFRNRKGKLGIGLKIWIILVNSPMILELKLQ